MIVRSGTRLLEFSPLLQRFPWRFRLRRQCVRYLLNYSFVLVLAACSPDARLKCSEREACEAHLSDASAAEIEDDADQDDAATKEDPSDGSVASEDTADASAAAPDVDSASPDAGSAPEAGAGREPGLGHASLLLDIETDTLGSDPREFTRLGADVYFFASNQQVGRGLFRITSGGATLVKELSADSLSFTSPLLAFKERLFFLVPPRDKERDGRDGWALWSSDGTSAGTTPVLENVGAWVKPFNMRVVGDLLYFVVESTSDARRALWRSDGTREGTVQLGQLYASDPRVLLGDASGLLYFVVSNGRERELWRTDGSNFGVRVSALPVYTSPSLVGFRGRAYFVGPLDQTSVAIGPRAVLVTDGTPESTKPAFVGGPAFPISLEADDKSLYVIGSQEDMGPAMSVFCSRDGVAVPEQLPVAIGNEVSLASGYAYFSTTQGVQRYDPASNSLRVLAPQAYVDPTTLTVMGAPRGVFYWSKGELYFADESASQRLQQDFFTSDARVIGDTVYLNGCSPTHGCEPWRSDASATDVRELADLNTTTKGSAPTGFRQLGTSGTVAFGAHQRVTGLEPWITRAQGETRLAQDVVPGEQDGFSEFRSSVGNFLFFGTQPPAQSLYINRLDATGAVRRLDIAPLLEAGVLAATPSRVYAEGATHYLTAPLGDLTSDEPTLRNAQDLELYGAIDVVVTLGNADYLFTHTPGSPGARINRWGPADTSPQEVAIAPLLHDKPIVDGASMYFIAGDQEYQGHELWRYSAAGGAERLSNFAATGVAVERAALHAKGGVLYVITWRDHEASLQRLREDQLEHLFDFDVDEVPMFAMLADNALLCGSHDLWVSDGTAAGTKKLTLDAGLALASACVAHAGLVYFSADDGKHGNELWRSDGSAAGTYIEADIVPGAQGSQPEELFSAGNLLYFRASHPLYGAEPWVVR